MRDKGIKFSVLAQEAIDWYVNHDRRDVRNFKGRMKFILEAFAAGSLKKLSRLTLMSGSVPQMVGREANVGNRSYPRRGPDLLDLRRSRIPLRKANPTH